MNGPVVLAWDNLNTHVSRAMAELAAARSWLTAYRLPPYASELNPVETVWSNLKISVANLTKQNIGQLAALVKARPRRMQFACAWMVDDFPRTEFLRSRRALCRQNANTDLGAATEF
ncbi:MAG: transposase [Trebonia sp.]